MKFAINQFLCYNFAKLIEHIILAMKLKKVMRVESRLTGIAFQRAGGWCKPVQQES